MVSRAVTLAVACVLSLFSFTCIIYPDAINALALIPANLLITHNYAWNLITCCLLQANIFRLLMDLLLLFAISYEVKWVPLDQFALYLGLSVLFCSIGTLLELLYRFYVSNSEEYLLEATYGCGGVIMSLMMFIRQQLKGKPVIPQLPVVTFHLLPTVFLTFFTVLFLTGEKFLTRDISFLWISYFFSWIYLRFFYKYGSSDEVGDSSEDFKFISMYPEVFHPVILPLSIAFYNLFALVGIFPRIEVDKKSSHHLRYHSSDTKDQMPLHFASAPSSSSGGASGGSVADTIAERRKAKAMKLLDAKLAALSQEPEGWEDQKVQHRSTFSNFCN